MMAHPLIETDALDTGAQGADRGDLRFRCMVRHEHLRGHAKLARHPGDALRHVARTRGVNAAGDLATRCTEYAVGGAAQLERADRLQRFQLEPHLVRRIALWQADQRRADPSIRDARAGGIDIGQRRRAQGHAALHRRGQGGAATIDGRRAAVKPASHAIGIAYRVTAVLSEYFTLCRDRWRAASTTH
jgi:hypothetical protein